jgi:ATP-dependent helicase IRC3
MINEGWLSDVLFTTVKLQNTDLSTVSLNRAGDFASAALSKVVNTPINNEAAVAAWFERCLARKSTLVFCVDVSHIYDLTATFKRRNIDARFVTGSTANAARANTIDAFKRGEFPVLLNCGVFTEGTDIPNIDCILLVRPTKSRNLLVQMIGRGMRLSPGKENCHVIDMVTSLKTGIVTTPTLYGLDPDEILESAKVKELQDLRERKEEESAARQELNEVTSDGRSLGTQNINMTFTDYSSVNDLIEDTYGERQIQQLTRYSWVQVDENGFVLATQNHGFLRIQKQDDKYSVKYTPRLWRGSSPYAKPREIIQDALTFEDALHGADKFAEATFNPLIFIEKYAPWRKAPASEAQLQFLNRFRTEDDKLTQDTLTKGRAQDMITKLKFGARGRFDKITAAKRRSAKDLEKVRRMDELKAREIVTVSQPW